MQVVLSLSFKVRCEFNLHVNKISFSYESIFTKTHLGKGADLNVEEKVVIHCGLL